MLQSDILKLRYDEDLNSIIMVWTGFAGSDEFRNANEEVFELVQNSGAKKLIGDLREMKVINTSNQQWLLDEWLPRIIDEGVRYFALVESNDFFNRKSVGKVVEEIQEQVDVRFFSTMVSARAWIRSVE